MFVQNGLQCSLAPSVYGRETLGIQDDIQF
jgi:hypothetical protein